MNGFKNLRPFLVVLAVATVFLITFFVLTLITSKDKDPHPAPDITGVTADGKSLYSLSEGQGKPRALIFFDLETRHSQELMQLLIPAAEEKGVEVVAVCIDAEDVAKGLARMKELEMPSAPHTLFDLDGEMAKTYNVTAGPVTYFIDKKGMIRSAYLAAISEKSLDKALSAIA